MGLADGAFYHPTRVVYDDPANYGLRCEDVTFPSANGKRLHAWFFPTPNARGTIVHCHGNAGNITAHFRFVDWLPAAGWNVLCFDYQGYGRSQGRVTRDGAIADVTAALRYARTRADVDPQRICVVGQSLGGSAAIVALARDDHDVAGLVVDGAFSSYRREARFVTQRCWWTWGASPLIARFLVSDDLSPIDVVGDLPPVPKLFICGDADRIVDFRQTVALYDAAGEPKQLWLIPDSDHTEALTGEIPGGRERVLAFLDRCVASADGAPVAETRRSGD